jgi:large conductance mechanosensitive channel
MLKEFRDFLMRGNVMDLAVAVVIGAAFSNIVNSLVNDIIMPIIGIILGGIDFSGLSIQVGSANVTYGNFLQAVVNFILIGWVIFLLIKAVNRLETGFAPSKEGAAEEEPAATPEDIQLLRQIRDLLERQEAR